MRGSDRIVPLIEEYNWYVASDNSMEYYETDKILIHPAYKDQPYIDDIALLHVTHSIKYTPALFPVCMPHSGDLKPHVGTRCTVSQWRASDSNNSK